MVLPLHDENPTRRRAVVTIALIVINFLVFVAYEPSSFRSVRDTNVDLSSQEAFLFQHAAIPCEVTHGERFSHHLAQECDGALFRQSHDSAPFFPHKNVYLAVIASMFLHASWAHLLFNMLFLWIFGNNVEDRLGRVAYVAFYLVCGIAAAIAHIVLNADSLMPVLGASGAIAGVMGCYLIFFPRARVVSIFPPLFFFVLRLPAWLLLIGWFVLQFQTGQNTGVAWQAHVGGFVAGAAIGVMVRPWAMRDAVGPRYVG